MEYLNAVLEAVKFPAGIPDLNTGLTNVNGDALSHFRWRWREGRKANSKQMQEDGAAFMKTRPWVPGLCGDASLYIERQEIDRAGKG